MAAVFILKKGVWECGERDKALRASEETRAMAAETKNECGVSKNDHQYLRILKEFRCRLVIITIILIN